MLLASAGTTPGSTVKWFMAALGKNFNFGAEFSSIIVMAVWFSEQKRRNS